MNKKASVIINTKDKLSRLRVILKALEMEVNEEIEVIIVFDGCEKKTLNEFKKLKFSYTPVSIISKKNIGRSAARNLGIRKATGEILIFIDDDRVPCNGFIQEHLNAHTEPCVVLGKRVDIFYTEKQILDLFENKEFSNIKEDKKKNLPFINSGYGLSDIFVRPFKRLRWMCFYTGNVSIPRNIMIDVGLFDEGFVGWGLEDQELGHRIARKGIKFKRVMSACNYHLSHKSSTNVKFKEFIRNLNYFMKKSKGYYDTRIVLIGLYMVFLLKRLLKIDPFSKEMTY